MDGEFVAAWIGANHGPWRFAKSRASLRIYSHIVVTMKKRTIPAGQFKAECLKLIDQVADTREPLIVTKRGKPVVEVIPLRSREVHRSTEALPSTAILSGPFSMHGTPNGDRPGYPRVDLVG